MASISIRETDFDVVATAALSAFQRGSWTDAAALDRLARKINAALASDRATRVTAGGMASLRGTLTWQDVPSVLPDPRTKP
jgi:hypothetical protein